MSTQSFRAAMPVPSVDSKAFWEGCDAGRLLLRHCLSCDTSSYYPRRLCPHCGSEELDWKTASGHGTIYTFSEVRISFFGPEWDDQVPYTVALIDLDEGPRMLSRLVLQPGQQAEIGARVEVVFVEVDGRKLPFFKL